MQKVKDLLTVEQPAINAVIDALAGELPLLTRPVARHVFQAGGKRLRPVLTLLVGRMLGCNDESLYRLGAAVEMLHAATLLHDDILDNSALRRGKATAHTIFNPSHVILAGDVMLAKALGVVAAFGDTRLTESISRAVMETANGQIEESANVRNLGLPYDEYLQIIIGKTAWLLRTSCELGALRAQKLNGEVTDEQVEAAALLGLELGIAFQLVDDMLDFSPPEVTGKPAGGDVLEGKMTPPIVFYLETLDGSERDDFYECFCTGSVSRDQLHDVCRAIESSGAIHKTRVLAEQHVQNALNLLTLMPEGSESVLLSKMAQYIVARAL